MHVFLTGAKGIGKSTLLRKIAAYLPGKQGGFRTVRTGEFLPDGASVHLLPWQASARPAQENLLFVCGQPDAEVDARFARLGCAALEGCEDCALLVMDELGPHEADAVAFREAVLRCVDGDIPVLGVLQAPAERFWPELVSHPKVRLFCLTEENRQNEALPLRLAGLLKKE